MTCVVYVDTRTMGVSGRSVPLSFYQNEKKKLSDFYKSIKEALENNLAETYTSLCALVTKGLKVSLIHFIQTNLYIPSLTICKVALKFSDIGVNAKSFFSNDDFNKDDKQ